MTLDQQILALLDTRDMRHYGIMEAAWNRADEAALLADAEDIDGEAVASAYRLALPHLDAVAKGEILAKLLRTSPKSRRLLS